ncbi:hypothetical protein Tco_0998161 [Tanacetum coccineum]
MQSLSGKLAALNRFLSHSAEKSLPFFKTLKNITKENKDDYWWIDDAEIAFQELKKIVLNLASLITPMPKETLEVSSGIAARVKKIEEIFEAYPIKVITNQPIKQILSKAEASEKLAKYFIELGSYGIAYEPRSATKWQVLADFINEVPIGCDTLVPRHTPYPVDQLTDCKEEWMLYTDVGI